MSSEQESNENANNPDSRPRLEQWSLVIRDPWLPPEAQRAYVNGKIYNDLRFSEGKSVTTSRVQEIDPEYKWVRTKSRIYDLGEMHPDFRAYLEQQKAR